MKLGEILAVHWVVINLKI